MQDNLARQLDFQEERRSEIIGGQVVMMAGASVNHNHITLNIAAIFRSYLKGKRCTPFGDGTRLFLTEEDEFIPDFMVVCDPSKIQRDGVYGTPDLVVEVLSPSTTRNDRGKKKYAYECAGVKEYWIVNPADKTVEVYQLHGDRLTLDDAYSIYPEYMFPNLVTEEERAALPVSFRCSLFDDLDIYLEDVFDRVT